MNSETLHNPQNIALPAESSKRLLNAAEVAILSDPLSARTAVARNLWTHLGPIHFWSEGSCRWSEVVTLPISETLTYVTEAGQLEQPGELDFNPDQLKAACEDFVESYNYLAKFHHRLMRRKGFWQNRDAVREVLAGNPALLAIVEDAMDCQLLALVTTEVSEGVEAIRHGNPPDDKIPEFKGTGAESADVFLRLMDVGHERGWNIAEALIAKMFMNAGRPPKHGKHF